MDNISIKAVGTKELWEQFQRKPMDIYNQEALRMKESGIDESPTMSGVLEQLSPSEPGDQLDAFERLMMEAGIRTKSNWRAGYFASNAASFLKNDGTRALFTEFFARNWRHVTYKMSNDEKSDMLKQERAILLSDTGVVGSWERPYTDSNVVRQDREVGIPIPVSELVAMTTPIDGDNYRSYKLVYDAEQLRKFRVGESADIPIADIVGSESSVRLKKYGRGLRATYEQMRRMKVDKLARFIQMMAIQSEVDLVSAALDVLVNGDGNASTAATAYNLTTLDSATTASNMTVTAWLAYKMLWEQPYMLSTALMRSDMALKVAKLDVGSANIPLAGANMAGLRSGFVPINQFADSTRYGWTSDAPANKIVGFDASKALERLTEIGSDITETARFVTNQTQVLVMSEVNGFAILDQLATKILVVNA